MGRSEDRKVEEWARMLVPTMAVKVDGTGVVLNWAGAANSMLGHAAGDVVGRKLDDFVCDGPTMDLLLSLSETPGEMRRVKLMHADGRLIPVELRAARGEGEERDSIIVAATPVGDDAESNRRLGQLGRFLDTVGAACGSGVWSYDLSSGTSFLSAETRRIYGFGPDESFVLADGIKQYPPSAREQVTRAFNDVIEQREAYDLELDFVRRDGAKRIVRTTGTPHFVDGELVEVYGLFQDVTEQRLLRAEVNKLQRDAFLGKLVKAVVHDINNLLCAILGSADFAEQVLPFESPVRAEMKAIERIVLRAARLNRKMLGLGRGSDSISTFDVASVVREGPQIWRRLLGQDLHELEVDVADEPAFTKMSELNLDLVLLNLIVNARDAMPKGGKIRVDLSVVGGEKGRISVRVSDSGPGIPAGARELVFTPQYSTKGGDGFGIGLATVRELVEEAGGRVFVDPDYENGASIVVELPLAPPVAVEPGRDEQDGGSGAEVSGIERVLIIEPVAELRLAIHRGLERFGYRIDSVPSFPVAWRALEELPVDLLIVGSDLSSTGEDVLGRVQREGLARSVLLVTALADGPTSEYENVTVLEKPFRARQLARAVRQALELPLDG